MGKHRVDGRILEGSPREECGATETHVADRDVRTAWQTGVESLSQLDRVLPPPR